MSLLTLGFVTTTLAQEFTVSPASSPDDQVPFETVEVMPQFPGGNEALMFFLSKNMKYPQDAAKNKIEGRALVSFIVEADGSISSVKMVKEVYPSIDAEAVRVVKSMPKWIPGRQKGKAVRVRFVLPLNFKLS
jgi:outer membrane transport energization protein TonB (TC 2.C.1.1.1)